MKNRNVLILLIGCLFPIAALAQVPDCADSGIQMRAHLKLKRYAEAAGVFEKMPIQCAVNDEVVFFDSEKVLQYLIQQSKNDDTKKAHVNMLTDLYDQYDKAHPQNGKGLSVRKAMLLDQQKMATDAEIYALLDKAFMKERSAFTDAQALYKYFELALASYKAGDKTMTDETFYSRYDDISIQLKKLTSSTKEQNLARRYQSAANGIRTVMVPIADCGKLTAYYENAFQKRSTDTLWLESVAKGIYYKACGSNAFSQKIAESWFSQSPNADSAENLAMVTVRSGDKDKAVKYMEEAIKLEKDKLRRAQLRYNLAVFAQSDKEKTATQLKKSVEENPKFGKAYLLLAQSYASSTACANSAFEVKVLNLLAAETVKKAGVADAELKANADKQAAEFMKKAPSADEIKAEKMAGKTVKFDCWINESVVIPKG